MPLDRSRTSHDFHEENFFMKFGPPMPVHPDWVPQDETYVFPTLTNYSRIIDDTEEVTRVRNGSMQVKGVRHDKAYQDVSLPLTPWLDWNIAPYWEPCIPEPGSKFLPLNLDQLQSWFEDVRLPDSLVRDFGYDVFNDFNDQFPGEISLPNFFWELREIATLIPKLSASFVTSAAGGYLNWQFGWEPFLADLRTLSSLMSVVDARLEFLRKTYGKVTRLGVSRRDVLQLDPTPLWRMYGAPHGLLAHTRGLVNYRVDLRAGCLFSHKLPWLNDVQGTLRAAAGALGLNNPLQVVWQAMPFSFVVDWFLNIGGALSQLDFQDRTVEWDIWNVHWSAKHTFDVEVRQRFNDSNGNVLIDQMVGRWRCSRYERFRGYPAPESMFDLDSLSPKQASLLAALILAN
jgi:hypothetical protein